jgi:uncharacterized Zn-binding protein involved in type VI secretion
MGKPAARLADPVLHPLPPVLTPGTTGSPTVLIGGQPAWRGLSPAAAAGLLSAMADAQIAITKAETATKLATPGPYQGAAEANEVKVKAEQAKKLADKITGLAAAGNDIHLCATIIPPPIHGPGMVIDASATVLINGCSACRAGDHIFEANVAANAIPNTIVMGFPTVLIGG